MAAWPEVTSGPPAVAARATTPFRRDVLDRLREAGPAAVPRHPGHGVGAVAVDGLDQQPQRHPDAGDPDAARRGRHRRPARTAAALGPGRARLPRGRRGRAGGGGPPRSRRAPAAGAGHRPGEDDGRYPDGAGDVGDAGEPADVEGVPGEWRVDPAAIGRPFTGRTALLSPFDRLVHDRRRAQELFEFEYHLEMYKPKAKRRWGYFALPVLHHDRLVGKLDATADRKAGAPRRARAPRGRPVHRGDARRRPRGDRAARRMAGSGGRGGRSGAGSSR